MVSLIDLAARRARGELRRTTRVPLCLDPTALTAWHDLNTPPGGPGGYLAAGGPPTGNEVEEARQRVLDATVMLEYQAIAPEVDYRISRSVDPEASVMELYRARVRAAYIAAYPYGSDTPDPEFTKDLVDQLIGAMTTGELSAHHEAVNRITQDEPEYPTSRR